jgi:uncharacterized protein YjiK
MKLLKQSIINKAKRILAAPVFFIALGFCQTASAEFLDLSTYTLSGTYSLPRGLSYAKEASAVTYNWDTDTFFVVGDEGEALVEVSKTGETISTMSLEGFDDTEGLTYVGGGQFIVTEERLRDAFLLTYGAGSSADRDDLASVDLGATVGNIGIEGISYDYITGAYYTVKEKDGQEINVNDLDFENGTADISSLFSPELLGLDDLSDIQSLSILGLTDGLLVLSQESQMLLEVDMSGSIFSAYDLSDLVSSVEGVTVDEAGNIYLVAENGSAPLMYVLSASPVPVPGSLALFGSALVGIVGWHRRKNHLKQRLMD